jgi:hypothetical protein
LPPGRPRAASERSPRRPSISLAPCRRPSPVTSVVPWSTTQPRLPKGSIWVIAAAGTTQRGCALPLKGLRCPIPHRRHRCAAMGRQPGAADVRMAVVPAHECSSNPSRRRRSSTSFNHQQFKRRCSSSPRFLSGSRPRAPAANDLPSFSLSTSAAHHCTRLRPSLYLLPVVHVLTLYFLFVAFGSTG